MKLKVRPEDFRVEELLRLRFSRHGRYTIYRLEKRDWNTLDVLAHIERKYRTGRLSRAGLKDRYSVAVQYVSAEGRGPGRVMEAGFTLKHIGHSTRPVSRELLLGNRFTIVLRDLTPAEVATAQRNLPALRADGFPNYYDEQRFGSSRHGAGFIARKLIEGDLESALRLYLATPSELDVPTTRQSKAAIAERWGDWARCLPLAKPEFAPALQHLVRAPDDYEGAIRSIRRELLELFVTSYQSWLWNETLSAIIRSMGLPVQATQYVHGELLFPTSLTPEARRLFFQHEIPVASPSTPSGPAPVAAALQTVLSRERLAFKDLRLPLRIPGLYFKLHTRPGVVVPKKLTLSGAGSDEIHRGMQKLEVAFELPPGSFATMLIRRLVLECPGT